MSHSLCLPNYSVGEDCYQKIGYYARHCGKKAAVIGGKTAMEKARDALLQGIDGSGIEILDFIWYGGGFLADVRAWTWQVFQAPRSASIPWNTP